MKKFTKIALIVASFVLVIALSVGGTIAWLTAKTEVVTNTFAPTDITIDLKEHDYKYDPKATPADLTNPIGSLDTATEVTEEHEYPMIPGATLEKDPFLRVNAKSEPCYIFVEVVETNNDNTLTTDDTTDKIISYEIDPLWKELPGVTGKFKGKVYYYVGNPEVATGDVVEYSETAQVFNILKNKTVSVATSLTNTYMDGITADNLKPALQFYGYAVQALGSDTAAIAWEKVPA